MTQCFHTSHGIASARNDGVGLAGSFYPHDETDEHPRFISANARFELKWSLGDGNSGAGAEEKKADEAPADVEASFNPAI